MTLEQLTQVGTILQAVVATAALLLVWMQIRSARLAQAEATASDTFRDYLKSAIDNPAFARPSLGKIDSTDTRSEPWVAYTYFVANMLFAFESILSTSKNDKIWTEAMLAHLRFHRRYLASEHFSRTREGYSLAVRALIDRVVAEAGLGQQRAVGA